MSLSKANRRLGKNSATLIEYFERNGAPKCADGANPAEYILDSIGAGATAQANQNWHELWVKSPEFSSITKEIKDLQHDLYADPNIESPVSGQTSTYAMPITTQILAVTRRTFTQYWRNPTYVMSKLLLNIISALFIGFTFFKPNLGVQAAQNKLFAIFMATICINFAYQSDTANLRYHAKCLRNS